MQTVADELTHHGIKGQKWGVRRYQNEDGSLTDAGRERYTAIRGFRDVSKILKDFSKSDLAKLRVKDADEYTYDTYGLVKRIITKEGGTPIGVIDIFNQGNGVGEVSIAVNPKYRGRGVASKLAKKASDYVSKGQSEVKRLLWSALETNDASIAVAKKNGYKYLGFDETKPVTSEGLRHLKYEKDFTVK